MTNPLFEPIRIGKYDLKNRIFMAPMTRGRSDENRAPTDLVAEYYRQRATAGLIITEATAVAARGHAWPGAPGIYTDQHQEGWAKVAKAVHGEGGRVFMQIWHMGRAVLSEYIDGQAPLSASAIRAEGELPNSKGEPTPFPIPEEMTSAQIDESIRQFVTSARRAVDAGIDGVELHAGNGFLIDSFLRDGTNQRTDHYGGSIENRSRYLLEVVDATIAEIGADRVGVRFSPTNNVFGIRDSDPAALFGHASKELSSRKLAFLHILEPANGSDSFMATDTPTIGHLLRDAYDGSFILNGALTQETGAQAISDGRADAVAYGAPFVSNPDLVRRFREGLPIVAPDEATFYTPGPEGYTTYPTYMEDAA